MRFVIRLVGADQRSPPSSMPKDNYKFLSRGNLKKKSIEL
jgi:hypothetical protein